MTLLLPRSILRNILSPTGPGLLRSLAVLVNFNVDPDSLFVETRFVRKKLLEAIDYTKLLGQRARAEHQKEKSAGLPLQLYRLKHGVLCKQKLDRAFLKYEHLETRLLLPRHAYRVMADFYLMKGRFENAHVRQVMGMLRSCFGDMEAVVNLTWSLRERLHRDISMNRRYLEKKGIDVVDVDWERVLHWGYQP